MTWLKGYVTGSVRRRYAGAERARGAHGAVDHGELDLARVDAHRRTTWG